MAISQTTRLVLSLCIIVVFVMATKSAYGQEASCVTTLSVVPPVMSATAGKELGVSAPEFGLLRRLVPSNRVIRLAVRVSDDQYALIYEADSISDPDPRVVLIRAGEVESEFTMRSLARKSQDDLNWRKSFKSFQYGWICAQNKRALYLSFQAGNSGGFFVGIVQSGQAATILPLGDVVQGRLVISVENPTVVEIWDVAPRDRQLCTGCRKHYTINTMDLNDGTAITKKTRLTKETYDGDHFQDHPLRLIPRLPL